MADIKNIIVIGVNSGAIEWMSTDLSKAVNAAEEYLKEIEDKK